MQRDDAPFAGDEAATWAGFLDLQRATLLTKCEDLTDAQLLARARESLPEWRRRDRIVEKAQAIEAATQRRRGALAAPAPDPTHEPAPRAYIPPYNLPSTDPDPEPTEIERVLADHAQDQQRPGDRLGDRDGAEQAQRGPCGGVHRLRA